ncbi:MAG TPA: ABC transporter ATP-binding protein [Gaiellaceae bacterium]|nr:ABC transporter ATP-binding protein [Gaiellaceae bacterium]
MQQGAVVAANVSRRFRLYGQSKRTLKEAVVRRKRTQARDVWAVRDASFSVEPGESVGILGRNGSGKTTLLRLIAGIFAPTEGRVDVGGSVGSLLGLGAGFHPEFSGRENVFLNGSLHGLSRRFVRERMDEIVAFSELEEFIDAPVRTYSSGMHMRLGFAVASHLQSDVLLLDEVFAVGDEAFQRKCFGKIFEFRNRGGTIFFVSHSAAAVEMLCERSLLLRNGRLEFDGTARDAIARYQALLAEDEDPEERGAGLQEWGSGEARVTEVRLEDEAGEPRTQYLAGEPLVALLRVHVDPGCPPPHVGIEIQASNGGLIAGASQPLAELGWAGGEAWVRWEVESLPLTDGRFDVAVSLADGAGSHVYHRRLAAASFVVYSEDEGPGGLVRLEGRWSVAGDVTAVGA